MSFSSDVKAELCKGQLGRRCCTVAEAYGVLLYCNTFSQNEVRIITESNEFVERLPKLFASAFGVEFDMVQSPGQGQGKHSFKITDAEKLDRIYEKLGLGRDKTFAHMINFSLLEDDCCRVGLIRGAFLAGGSVTSPDKRYHLELVTGHYNVSRGIMSLLLDMDFSPKEIRRKGNFVTYFKLSEAIEDFLTKIGAPLSAMQIMNAKVEKDMRNSVQRRVNCDTANVEKSVEAAQGQIAAIRRLEKTVGLESLPDKLQQTAILRAFNPEASLAELAELANPPVSKSCISYRLRKIMEIANTDRA